MKPNEQIKKLARYEASLSSYKFRVGAVIYHGRTIIGRGFNDATKTHPASPHPFFSRHAEFNAFLHAYRRYNDVRNSSIYVHRILANGDSGNSKPCQFCAKLLSNVGIKEIYWSEDKMELNRISGV